MNIAEIRRNALRALIPPPRLRLSEWIESHVHLPEGVSSLPGPVSLWPPQVEIADAIGDPTIERVTLVKPVRVGFTTLLTGALAGYVANDPAPILALLPTESDCRDYIVSDVEPIFSASPSLAGLLDDDGGEGGRNTLLSRRFPGGSLKVVAARAPRNLRRHNVRVLLIDEADGMEITAEGNPLVLAERRTLSFADRKIITGSTPVFEDTSHVLRAYAASDQRIYEVPCPECGDFHEITWKDIQWPEGEPERAHYVCPHCGCVIDERHKPGMVAKGRWRAQRPEVKGHAGFRMNALISTLANASWAKLATEFVTAKGDPTTLQTFVNTILAQGWKVDAEEVDDVALANGAERFGLDAIPEAVLVITAGIDVQRDRLEMTLLGWAEDGSLFALAHEIIPGDPADDTTWAELDTVLRTRWPHPCGAKIGIDAAVIDAGDGVTMERVVSFCAPRASRKIMAGKGVAGARPWIERSKSKTAKGRLWLLGVDGIKTHVLGLLAKVGAVRFSDDLPGEWFAQVASERLVVRYVKGMPVRRFERIPGRRAESLDCMVYAIAARQVMRVDWIERADQLRRGVLDAAPKAKALIKSNWMR
ncbi:phage terminase large subunit family protein [Paracoccus saliphilus]|uniref:Phage terminase large subunit family protein n=1 Tax=Paracoccus saliphilus TaxID=405559 RepID=A0AA45W2Z6_9RHOB|nr:phage terminase large subunit family protein [Paracoccus saliphilus]WCR04994.1 phage terminase large subunit family protein [Paracoccus saliphilus]SIS71577.1 Phage terminase, large subunit GpA [Paracoccus saliphilus]